MNKFPFYIIYGTLFLIYIFNVFIQSHFIHLFISWSALAVLIFSFYFASRLFKIIGAFFTVAGVGMSVISGVPILHIPEQFINNFPMLLFLSMLPWMASAFSIGEYDQNLKDMIHTKNNRLGEMYGKSIGTSYSLVMFINVSAIYLVQQILMDKLKGISKAARNDFIIKVTLRTFSMAVIWSPMEIVLGIAVDSTGVSFLTYLPWLLLCSFLLAVIDIIMNRRAFSEIEITSSVHLNQKELMKALMKLFFVLFTFFTVIIVSNHLFKLNFILTVSLVIFPFTLIWSLFMRRIMIFLKYGWRSWKNYNNSMQNFIVLFLTLALFSEGFKQSAIPGVLQQILGGMTEYTLLIFIFITMIYFALGLIGVHPIATIAILIEVVSPLFSSINPLSIGIVLIVSALATSASAPYGINATLSSQNLGVTPYYITRVNYPFSILMSAVGIAVAMFVL